MEVSFADMRPDEMSAAEQERLLDEALKVVKQDSFEMKRALDKGRLLDALKHAAHFLTELKTNSLSPKFYYRLYIDVVNEMQHLEQYLTDCYEKGQKTDDLYETVQYAGAIIPRLYLLITVGVVYMKTGEGSRSDILKDLVEMCRGVQHPLRGLFLRNYLLQSTRNLLPDAPDPEEGVAGPADGTVSDAIDFILLNFSEMNKLWVRMQHQGPSREREKREKERMELRILVGTNLVRLSQLENTTLETYTQLILPSVLEQVVSCRDAISQEYLMECVIQVFPDEFHLATLNDFLAACAQLQMEVNIKNVLIALIDRLALFAANPESEGIPENIKLFDIFSEQANTLIAGRPDMPLEDIVGLHAALVSLAVKCYRERTDFANTVFAGLAKVLGERDVNGVDVLSPVGRELGKLLRVPVDEYNDVLRVAGMEDVNGVRAVLDYRGRCRIALHVVQNLLDNDTYLCSEEDVGALQGLVEPLLVDQPDQKEGSEEDEDFQEEQCVLARAVHLIRADTHDQQFLFLNGWRKQLGAGGKWRIRHTLPPLVFALYKLAAGYERTDEDTWAAKARKMFVCAMGTIGALITTGEMAELPLKLYLEGAVIADKIDFGDTATVVYEFISKALSVLEDEIADSRDRLVALALVTSTMITISSLDDEHWQPLASQIVLAAAKMFKKPDQVRALCSAAHLFWEGRVSEGGGQPMRDGAKVAEILRKALKISSQCMEPVVQQQLFIHTLNYLHHFYADGCEQISGEQIAELVSRCKDGSVQLEVSAEADALEKQMAATLAHIKREGEKREKEGKETVDV